MPEEWHRSDRGRVEYEKGGRSKSGAPHSERIGGKTRLAAVGAGASVIQREGVWLSDAFVDSIKAKKRIDNRSRGGRGPGGGYNENHVKGLSVGGGRGA